MKISKRLITLITVLAIILSAMSFTVIATPAESSSEPRASILRTIPPALTIYNGDSVSWSGSGSTAKVVVLGPYETGVVGTQKTVMMPNPMTIYSLGLSHGTYTLDFYVGVVAGMGYTHIGTYDHYVP